MLYQIEADSQNGNVVLYLLCGVLGCGSMGGLIEYVGLWDLYCDPLRHDNVIWFLSGVECMVIWFG